MIQQDSGKIYAIPLQFSMGFAPAYLMDYTDQAPFDGVLLTVLKSFAKDFHEIEINEIAKRTPILFGPISLNKRPNIKGKDAWRYLGQDVNIDASEPTFKSTTELVKLHHSTDWASIGNWYKATLTGDTEFVRDYEEVRYLEPRTLYNPEWASIRATMHLLILKNKSVADFFDLSNESFRRIYFELINTSFDKKFVYSLIEKIA